MPLQEAAAPNTKRDLNGTIDEIVRDGAPHVWYLVAEYDLASTARTTAYSLRSRFPNIEIIASEGRVLARRGI